MVICQQETAVALAYPINHAHPKSHRRKPLIHQGTAYFGLIANGFDFIHVPLMLFAPGLGAFILAIGGIFYLFWFPLLGRDLYRLGKG